MINNSQLVNPIVSLGLTEQLTALADFLKSAPAADVVAGIAAKAQADIVQQLKTARAQIDQWRTEAEADVGVAQVDMAAQNRRLQDQTTLRETLLGAREKDLQKAREDVADTQRQLDARLAEVSDLRAKFTQKLEQAKLLAG